MSAVVLRGWSAAAHLWHDERVTARRGAPSRTLLGVVLVAIVWGLGAVADAGRARAASDTVAAGSDPTPSGQTRVGAPASAAQLAAQADDEEAGAAVGSRWGLGSLARRPCSKCWPSNSRLQLLTTGASLSVR